MRSLFMKTLIGAAIVAGVVAFAGPAAIDSAAAAAPMMMKAQIAGSSDVTDISARRHYRHYHRYGYYPRYDRYRPFIRPYYYARPYYYRPYPYYAPVPFFLGFGFGPFGW